MTPPTRSLRRHFLLTSAALVAGPLGNSSGLSAEPGSVQLRGGGHDLFRVRIEMEVEGNVNVPKNALVSRKSSVKLPIKSDAVFDYEERYFRPAGPGGASSGRGGESANSRVTAIERYYHQAESDSLLNRTRQKSQLRESVRETVVRRELLPEVIYAVEDYFHRDELELLRIPASSVAADELLPAEAVTAGSNYTPSREALRSVLNLTSIEASDVQAEVVSITEQSAKIQFRGKVDGSVEGVPTVIRTVGKITFNRLLQTCTWLAMAVHETREIGKAEPGFDVAATIKMVRKPLDRTMALSPQRPADDFTAAIPGDRLYVGLRSRELGFSVLMDRRWRMMSDLPGTAMMRMTDNDRSIAQCDFRPLVALEAGTQWSLEAFQADVKQTLGEQLVDFVEADQRVSENGLRVLRVTAHGAVQGVPIQWVILHFSNDSGRRMLATFTMEGHNMESFAGADAQLASTLRLTELPERKSQEVAAGGEGRAGADRVAEANLGEDSDAQVQSASDLR